MELVKKELLICGSEARKGLETLFDSGGSVCFVREDVARGLPYPLAMGADFLQRWKIGLDSVKEELIVDEEALEIFLV